MSNEYKKPNILMIVVHDIGTSLGCYGNSDIQTPYFDNFAEQGIRFENNFCTAPFCSPSRGSIITGKYPHVNGLMGLTNLEWDLPDNNTTDAMFFTKNDYETILFGYQHESKDPKRLGFEKVYRIPGDYADKVSDQVIDFIDNRGEKDKPFYARVGFFDTHRIATWDKETGRKTSNGWEKYRDRAPAPETITVPKYMEDKEVIRRDLADFYGSVNYVDEHFGRILGALDRNKMADNTIVIFTNDHGIAFPRAKSTLYDPGINTTLLMCWPEGFIGGKVYNEMISNIDLLPTLLESCGIDIPEDIQGKSFMGLLKGEKYSPNEIIFAEKNTDPSDIKRCIRTKDWKLIHNYNKGPSDLLTRICSNDNEGDGAEYLKKVRPEWELYDLIHDPFEFNNLAGIKEYDIIEAELKKRLHELQIKTKDPVLTGMMPRPLKEAEAFVGIIKSNLKLMHFDQ